MTHQAESLAQGWAAIARGCLDARGWVEAVRGGSRRLDNEADKLNLSLLRSRNLASNLAYVASTPMTVGFFGISQAGKSYLISALAAGSQGALEAAYGDRRVDFIKEVNPVGSGKEATGLVTRFTRQAPAAPAGYPVPLRLFSEIEIAKILANAWFNDFNHEQLEGQLDESRIEQHLRPFLQRAGQQPASGDVSTGVSSEDVVALWDYLDTSFKKSVAELKHAYWPQVLKIAPTLRPDDRAELFSLLWGEQPALTETYRTLARALAKLSHATTVFAPLETLTDHSNGSIMNVDSLNRLGSHQDRHVEVRFWHDDRQLGSASLLQGELTALTAELIFPLAEIPDDSIVEQVDLLDFPGYRGRLKLTRLEDAGQGGLNPVSQLLLRGKVAYLFERYTDNQEMNALVVCASAAKQSDVADVGPVLNRWVEKTQGKDAAERAASKPGLFWAITMCDMRISSSLEFTEAQLKDGWEGMLHITLTERFGHYDWLTEWAPKQRFKNCFLVRKPGIDNPFLSLASESGKEKLQEVAFAERYHGVLDQMGQTFINNKSAADYFDQPQVAWQAMLSLNDGGMRRLTDGLRGVASLEFKLQRLQQQLLQYRQQIGHHELGRWYEQGGEDQRAKKQAVANVLWQGLSASAHRIGELIARLELPGHELKNIYLSIRHLEQPSAAGDDCPAAPALASNPFGDNPFGSNPFGDSPFGNSPFAGEPAAPASATSAAAPAAERVSQEDEFAHQAFKAWVAHLRELPLQTSYWSALGMNSELINPLCEELITAATRLDLQGTLKQVLAGQESADTLSDQLQARQVLRVQLAMRDFIAWFGYLTLPQDQVPNSYVGEKKKVFARQTSLTGDELPQLAAVAPQPGVAWMGDWLSALMTLILDNAGHSATRDISFEHNQQLGQIIRQLQQENTPC